jgi:hypothetical protein
MATGLPHIHRFFALKGVASVQMSANWSRIVISEKVIFKRLPGDFLRFRRNLTKFLRKGEIHKSSQSFFCSFREDDEGVERKECWMWEFVRGIRPSGSFRQFEARFGVCNGVRIEWRSGDFFWSE